MKNILTYLILFSLVTSCFHEKNDIRGTWLNSDFSYPETLFFTDSIWSISTYYHFDSLPYYLYKDSLFLQGHYSPDLVKYSYSISGDTLWTEYNGDNEIYRTKYFKQKSDHFFNDIKKHLGIEIDLPTGFSQKIGLRNGNSIYFPKQTNNEQIIFLNNEQFILDTLLHERLFKLFEQNEFIYQNLFGLYIDSEITYDKVKLLKNELRKAGFYKVVFISDPSGEKYYESNVGIQRKLLPITENEEFFINPDIRVIVDKSRPPNPPTYFFENPDFKKPNVCKVEIMDNQVLFNEQKFNVDIYYEKLKKNDSLYTYLKIDNGSNYGTYYFFISTHDSLRQEIKNEISIELFKNEYDDLIDTDKIKKVNSLCKIGLIEY